MLGKWSNPRAGPAEGPSRLLHLDFHDSRLVERSLDIDCILEPVARRAEKSPQGFEMS